ncbi:MAG: hypothetical protein JWO41_195 [Candidatus Saccharibacteria bacterium]|nr:hypothetical protein [Candidatus Saccharibacteria bacterium]
MAVAAAERQTLQDEQFLLETVMPEVFVVPEMLSDHETVEKTARFIGAVMAGHTIELEAPSVEKPIESLFDAVHKAAHGDKEAEKVVELNARTDIVERAIKVGHVTEPVPLFVTDQGKVVQHGQSYDSIQANSLRYAAGHGIMQARTEAEARNAFRTERLLQEGYFDDGYSLVVFSRAEKLPGFFTETMSVSIQVTRKQGDGLAVQTAFVAGIAQEGGAQHDEQSLVKLGAQFGVDLSGLTTAELIDKPLLIKDMTALELVKRYDDCAGGTFFGEYKQRQDYEQYLTQCQEREKSFAPKVAAIKAELIAEAATITTPMQASRRLNKISGKHLVEQAIIDTSIDARVFGPGAMNVVQARLHNASGDSEGRDRQTALAVRNERSSSCPSGMDGAESAGGDTGETDSYGSLSFTCKKGHSNTRPHGMFIENCQVCGDSVRC